LTTAAGLWASAIVGLCCGAGFYLGAVVASALILVAELLMSKLEWYVIATARTLNVFIEYQDAETLSRIVDTLRDMNISILDMELTRSPDRNYGVTFSLGTSRKMRHEVIMNELMGIRGVILVEEL
jgi:putative Mg2+ transporter-C (MgtC) family protein